MANTGLLGLQSIGKRLARMELATSAILDLLGLPNLGTYEPEEPAYTTLVTSPQYKPGPPKEGPYNYVPLDPTKGEIRLLTLHQASNDWDPVTGQLITINLDDQEIPGKKELYTTLSYTWGEPIFDHFITINGHQFPVTASLESGLRHMRNHKKAQITQHASLSEPLDLSGVRDCWWVDQICINQADVDERAQQVSLMRRTYKQSHSVAVWLGEEADNSSLAMSLLSLIESDLIRGPGEKVIKYEKSSPAETASNWKALASLFQRPWWERAWIRQEVALSYAAVVHCGSSTCYLHNVVVCLRAFAYSCALGYVSPYMYKTAATGLISAQAQQSAVNTLATPVYQQAQDLAALCDLVPYGENFVNLIPLLRHTRSSKATDPRDKVYAVLGLVDPKIYAIQVDYRTPYRDVYIGVAKYVLKMTKADGGGLDLLGIAQNGKRSNGLPSWTPDLSTDWKATPFPKNDKMNVTHSEISEVKFVTVSLEVDDNADDGRDQHTREREVMEVKGLHIDTISHICPTVISASMSHLDLEASYSAIQTFLETYGNSLPQKLKNMYPNKLYVIQSELEPYYTKPLPHSAWINLFSIGTANAREILRYDNTEDKVLPETRKMIEQDFKWQGFNIRAAKAKLLSEMEADEPHEVVFSVHPLRKMFDLMVEWGVGRRVCVSARGKVALVPAEAQIGDSVAIMDGATYPYILRREERVGVRQWREDDDIRNGEEYVLIGECYVPAYKEGAAFHTAQEEGMNVSGKIRIV